MPIYFIAQLFLIFKNAKHVYPIAAASKAYASPEQEQMQVDLTRENYCLNKRIDTYRTQACPACRVRLAFLMGSPVFFMCLVFSTDINFTDTFNHGSNFYAI